jgi:hypothetical protein
MPLQQQFVSGGGGGNPRFLGTHQDPSFSVGQSTSSCMDQHSSSTTFLHPGSSWDGSGVKLFNVQQVSPFSSERVSGANQHLQTQMSHGNRASSSVSSCPNPQEFKNLNVLSGIAAETQTKLFALKQQHVKQRHQLCRQNRTSTSYNASAFSRRFLNPSNERIVGNSSRNYYLRSGSRGSLISNPTEHELAVRSQIEMGIVFSYKENEDHKMVGAAAAMEGCAEEGSAGIRPAGDFLVTPVPLRNDDVREDEEEEDDGERMELGEHSGTTCQMVDGRKFERWWAR